MEGEIGVALVGPEHQYNGSYPIPGALGSFCLVWLLFLIILTIFKCTIQWHKVHSLCCITITTIYFLNFFIIPNRKTVLIKPWEVLKRA